MKTKALLYLFIIAFAGCGDANLTGTSGGIGAADSVLLFQRDSLTIYTTVRGEVNVQNNFQFTNVTAGNVFAVSFTGEVDSVQASARRNMRYASVTLDINNTITWVFAKYNERIFGSHYFTLSPSITNFILWFYIKIYVNNQALAFIKLKDIKVYRIN